MLNWLWNWAAGGDGMEMPMDWAAQRGMGGGERGTVAVEMLSGCSWVRQNKMATAKAEVRANDKTLLDQKQRQEGQKERRKRG